MRKTIIVCGLFVIFLSFQSVAGVGLGSASESRDEIVARQLDCVARHYKGDDSLLWADVCYSARLQGEAPAREQEAPDMVLAQTTDEEAVAPKRGAQVTVDEMGNIVIDGTEVAAEQPEAMEMDEPLLESESMALPGEDEDLSYLPPDKKEPGSFWQLDPIFQRENDLTKLVFGAESFFYAYREPGLMRQEGMMNGVFASYTFRTSENEHIRSFRDVWSDTNKINMFRIDGRVAYGELDYESEGTGSDNGIPNYSAEIRGVMGYDIPMFESSRLTPFLGFGYRYLLDDGGGRLTTTGHWGYDRESHYYYFPIGLESQIDLKNNWSISFVAEYDWFVDGEQVSHMEDGGTGYDTLENDQDKGYGMRGSVRIMKQSERIDFFCEPFVRYWNIGNSDVAALTINGQVIPVPGNPGYVYGGREPENNTTEYGVKVGIRY